jgi:hypothetical protein
VLDVTRKWNGKSSVLMAVVTSAGIRRICVPDLGRLMAEAGNTNKASSRGANAARTRCSCCVSLW